MLILENVFIVLSLVLLFILTFTFINILAFTKDFATGIFLTFIFFDLFLRMPFKSINIIYNDKEKLMKKVDKDKELSVQDKKQFKLILQSKFKLFVVLYKTGEFSYSELMTSLRKWFFKKPFKVRVRVAHMNRKRFEDKYLNDMKKDLIGVS